MTNDLNTHAAILAVYFARFCSDCRSDYILRTSFIFQKLNKKRRERDYAWNFSDIKVARKK